MLSGVYHATYDAIVSLRRAGGGTLDWSTRKFISQLGCGPKCGVRRGCRAGLHVQRRRVGWSYDTGQPPNSKPKVTQIPVIIGHRPSPNFRTSSSSRTAAVIDVTQRTTTESRADEEATKPTTPTLYVLNVAAITKPHAVQHLAAELAGYEVDIAIITETHLKQKHSNNLFAIDGYTLFRRDRAGRRGGGVAMYVNNRLHATVWLSPIDESIYELLWVRVQNSKRDVLIGALYHPPKPIYQTSALLTHLEKCVDLLSADFPDASVILAGDFNALHDDDIITRCALTSIVDQPTRGDSNLDRIYVSELDYAGVKVVQSAVKSDHKAVIAYNGPKLATYNKRRERKVFRQRSPSQHALFLEHISQTKIELASDADVQTNFDAMYARMRDLLDSFYPERLITVTSTDPRFVTPAVKALLRRKNRLMRAGRIEKASALARRVQAGITRRNTSWLRNINTRKSPQDAWAKVREVIGKARRGDSDVDGITAQVLNDYYAAISTDRSYQEPALKSTALDRNCCVTEIEVFHMLDHLRPTATGLDGVPAWFLRLGAPLFAAPLAQLFNQSVAAGIVPRQWKAAMITPVPKVNKPIQPSDFRPISITPVLSRAFERHIVKSYIYPALKAPPPELHFGDQFAFRPTGSTAAAIIALLHTVLVMLSTNHYVRVFALDFSKAFDTVRHATLIDKMAKMQIPDQIFNWIKNFFDGHTHCTKYKSEISTLASIQASVIQGSGLGPASYLVTAADLRPVSGGNCII